MQDTLVTDPRTGKTTGLAKTVRRAIKALEQSGIPYCVIGATALAVRGLPRMTRDLDIAVRAEDSRVAIAALRKLHFRQATPAASEQDDEFMVLFVDPATGVEVDLLAAAGDPESTVIGQARKANTFGVLARVASLEHLLLLYLYSNQPRHFGDFGTIIQSGRADLKRAQEMLAEMHPEMLREWKRRVKEIEKLPPAPRKPRNGREKRP